jgi:hypothetical protein
MPTLPTDLRNKLERTCIAARNLAERAASDALKSLAVAHHEPYGHMTVEQRNLRNKLRAHARQVGDRKFEKPDKDGDDHEITHLAQECAYEHWHRMLFARFLAENNLLIETDMGVAVSLEEVKELAKDAKTNLWALAGRYAQTMLPEIFRADDPVLQVPLAREDQIKLEQLLDALAKDTFTAGDSLGWCYQFWQTERKAEINKSENPRGADEIPSVTQLFTEDYMVDFLLDNTLGAWWAGKKKSEVGSQKSEEEARRAVSLPGCPWKYLRFLKDKDSKWTPAAGTFDGWPKTAKELKALDPCCGSGHFIVAMFQRLVALRLAEEKLDEKVAVAAVIRDNLFGLELDPRCTQIGAFSVALAAWRRVGHCALPPMHIACSGLAPNAREADWLKLAGDSDKLQRGMARLYRLFQNAPVLGSLINPRAGGGDLLEAGFQELRPLLAKALEAERFRLREGADDTAHEMAVTAQGITKAAEILAGQFTLVATNVPYLGRNKQDDCLKDYCERVFPYAKSDLATCFVERSLDFCGKAGSIALVTLQNWLFYDGFQKLRTELLKSSEWNFIARLGPKGFRTPMWDFNAMLLGITRAVPDEAHSFFGMDVSDDATPDEKDEALFVKQFSCATQRSQLHNPGARIGLETAIAKTLLGKYADLGKGSVTGDGPHYLRKFWEIAPIATDWRPWLNTPNDSDNFSGREHFVFWRNEGEEVHQEIGAWLRGDNVFGRAGILINKTTLGWTYYAGEMFDDNTGAIIPLDQSNLKSVLAFITDSQFPASVKEVDQSLKVTIGSFGKIPFDLAHWQKVAAEKYPHGLPKPFSSDPTQWLFNGHPKESDQPLQVAVARLLGYRWPRQTGSSFPDCPALAPDGLEKLADDDGIVCLPSVRGEEPAAERLRKFLRAAYDADWKSNSELALIHATGSKAGDLDEWLRNEFFEQHCGLFQHRPFVLHVWDGRKRDGFHALVNYHTLAGGDKGRRTLENLTHSYLGDWITRQKDGMKRAEEGADERLAAALALKEKLEMILTGEPPFDVFVRWKPLAQQSIGWQPDINDGVRMNIRPFAIADILRKRVKIKWEKDRGNEPKRENADYPWFWKDGEFTGDRVNDVHLTKEQKEQARKA